MHPNSLFLLIVTVLALIWCYLLFKDVYYTGKTLGYKRMLGNFSQRELDVAIESHKRAIKKFVLSLLTPVALIETIVLLEGGRWGNPLLFLVHVLFIFLFLGNLVLQWFVFTGLGNPKIHRFLFRFFIAWTIGMAGTGSLLIVQLFSK